MATQILEDMLKTKMDPDKYLEAEEYLASEIDKVSTIPDFYSLPDTTICEIIEMGRVKKLSQDDQDPKALEDQLLFKKIQVEPNYIPWCLYEAAKIGDLDSVKWIIQNNIEDVDNSYINDKTPLIAASKKGHYLVVRYLIEIANANINYEDGKGLNALEYSLERHHIKIRSYLFTKMYGNIPFRPNPSIKNIYEAIDKKDTESILWFLENDYEDGKELLQYLTKNCYRNYEMIEFFILSGKVDLNIKDDQGMTLLHHVAKENYKRLIKILCDSGVDINAQDLEGMTPLHYATETGARYKYDECVKMLVDEYDADINVKDYQGRNPLYIACANFNDVFVYRGITRFFAIDCGQSIEESLGDEYEEYLEFYVHSFI